MVSRTHISLRAEDRSYFAILKKEIHSLAITAGFSDARVGELDIVVAELVSNLVKHAGGGQVLVKLVEQSGLQGIELISIDNGPGMTDVSRMVADGVSTKNTLGQGLGAMKRLSDVFQVYSIRNWGTVILIRLFTEELPRFKKADKEQISCAVLPKPGETACGDGFFQKVDKDQVSLFLGDGLGHGPDAAHAVMEAGKAFLDCEEKEPSEVIKFINSAVKKTRGLVGTIAILDLPGLKWKICGVGNISSRLINGLDTKNLMPYNGIIGLNVPRSLNTQVVEFEKGQQLVMCSDGLKTKWETTRYAAIQRYDASVLCASLLKDYARNTDDMSVAVCKINL